MIPGLSITDIGTDKQKSVLLKVVARKGTKQELKYVHEYIDILDKEEISELIHTLSSRDMHMFLPDKTETDEPGMTYPLGGKYYRPYDYNAEWNNFIIEQETL